MIGLRCTAAQLLSDRSGAGAVEFALVLPAVLMVIVGGIHLCLVSYTLAGLHYATGHYRHGILMGPLTARMVVDEMRGGSQVPDWLGAARFA